MSDSSTTITLDRRLTPVFVGAGAAVGLASAFAVGPMTTWLLNRVDSAPGVLRLIDLVPFAVAAPGLAIVGAIAGWLVFGLWSDEVGDVTIDAQRVGLSHGSASTVFEAAEVTHVFMDRDELVLVGHDTRELSRTASESGLARRLGTAFQRHGYPWRAEGDPRESEFTPWVDRTPGISEDAHALLRERRRALTDKRAGEAESLRDRLSATGVVVRDRNDSQQIRTVDG